MWKIVNMEELRKYPMGTKVNVNNEIITEISKWCIDGGVFANDELPDGSFVITREDFEHWTIKVFIESSKKEVLVNTIFDEEYQDYTTAVTKEVLIDFVETNVKCDDYLFIEKLLEVLTHEQCKELVKTIFHLESVE